MTAGEDATEPADPRAGLAAQLRDALDIPSRSEIQALTEALARAEARVAGAPPAGPSATKDAADGA